MMKDKTVDFSEFHLVPKEDLIAPEQSRLGEEGHGEGVKIVVDGKSRLYFYRFAGKRVPRRGIAYLTCEDNYFSRVRGEKSHVIVTWDDNAQGFRVLLSSFLSGFMKTYSSLSKLSIEDVVSFVKKQDEDKNKSNTKLMTMLNNIENYF